MLTARKSGWFEKIFAIYGRNLFKRRFEAFSVSGIDILQSRNKSLPSLIYCNHSSWWDGLAAFEISQTASLDSFVMMEEKQLKNLQLFRRLGAFSVIRENPRKAVESVNYAIKLLKEKPDRALWIFPQGEILPNDARPLKFYNGVSRIIEKTKKCAVVPLAMRYEFLGAYKPEVFVKIGQAEIIEADGEFDAKKLTARLENTLTITLDSLKRDVAGQDFKNYKRLI